MVPKQQKGQRYSANPLKNGRSGEIRTHDPLLPKQVRYQAALHSDCRNHLSCITRRTGFAFGKSGHLQGRLTQAVSVITPVLQHRKVVFGQNQRTVVAARLAPRHSRHKKGCS